MSEIFHFQVNLGGMLDVLSNHLYKSPDVFLRELLQNGVDAITLRQKLQPDWSEGSIHISLDPGRHLIFRDNGSGLTQEEIHRFLSVIGQSSKNNLEDLRYSEDYIGRFGIGLLSCFMVSDSIVVETRSIDGGIGHVWTGLPDGTYTLNTLEDCPLGTAVILTAKPGLEHYFFPEKIKSLVCYYGLTLPAPVYLEGYPEQLNKIPADFSIVSHSQLLAFGDWLFEEEFLDAIPIQTKHLNGVAFILPYQTNVSVKNTHRIYLKHMLLTEQGDTLLPSWAFFLRCFLNTSGLRPTASREDFYEDTELDEARKEFTDAVQAYLYHLSVQNPNRLQSIVILHELAIKSIAVWDNSLFQLFIDYLNFQTSEGSMTGAMLKEAGPARWTSSLPRFKQLKPIFLSQNQLLICTNYTYDDELIHKMIQQYHLPITPLQEETIDLVLEEPTAEENLTSLPLLNAANRSLCSFDCKVELRHFLPSDLPVLYSISDEVQFLRQIQNANFTENMFSNALSSLLASVEERPLAILYLNGNSPLIQQLKSITNTQLLESIIKVLYIQALLAGGHPLKGGELKILNQALLDLVENASP